MLWFVRRSLRGTAVITRSLHHHLATTQGPKTQAGICLGLFFLLFSVPLSWQPFKQTLYLPSVSVCFSIRFCWYDQCDEQLVPLWPMISTFLSCQSAAFKCFAFEVYWGTRFTEQLKINDLQLWVCLYQVLSEQVNGIRYYQSEIWVESHGNLILVKWILCNIYWCKKKKQFSYHKNRRNC